MAGKGQCAFHSFLRTLLSTPRRTLVVGRTGLNSELIGSVFWVAP